MRRVHTNMPTRVEEEPVSTRPTVFLDHPADRSWLEVNKNTYIDIGPPKWVNRLPQELLNRICWAHYREFHSPSGNPKITH